MRLNRDKQIYCDYEVGTNSITETFILNMTNLHTDDRKELLNNILLSSPRFTALEFLSVFNAAVEGMSDRRS